MASLNRAMIIGSLGKDPELRYTPAGVAVAGFNVATSDKIKGKEGAWEERTEWHRVTLWGKLAEIAGEYLAKGKLVYIEGRLQTRKWADKDGVERFTTEIIGEKMQMLSGRGEGAGKGAGASHGNQASGGNAAQGKNNQTASGNGSKQSGPVWS